MLDHVYLKKVDQLHEIVNLAEKPDEESCQSSQPLQSAMADMFPGFDEVSRPLLLRCASFMMENVFNDIKDVANFTSRCSEEGHTSAALKLLNIIKDLSEKHPSSQQEISKVQPSEPGSSSTTTNNRRGKKCSSKLCCSILIAFIMFILLFVLAFTVASLFKSFSFRQSLL